MSIWTILGIEPSADMAAIKKAYARRAAERHPEDDPQSFQALHEAYLEALEIAATRLKRNPPPPPDDEPELDNPAIFKIPPENLINLGFAEAGEGGREEFSPRGANGQPESPPTPRNNESGGEPAYAFPPPEEPAARQARTEDDQTPKKLESGGEYRFTLNDAAEPLSPSPADQPGGPLVFPNFRPVSDDEPESELFIPPPVGLPLEYRPPNQEDEDRRRLLTSARECCLEEMKKLLEQSAPEQAWYPLLRGVDFTVIQYDGIFLLALLELIRHKLSLEMTSALYMAYGFASRKSLTKYPATATLHTILNQQLQLPQDDIQLLPLSENLHKCDLALAGLARLSRVNDDNYICGQALRTPLFIQVKHQPYFINKLAAALEGNEVAESWGLALARAYQLHGPAASPVLGSLFERLPDVIEAKDQAAYTPLADNLLLGAAELEAFYDASREALLDLLKKTRKNFPQSRRREPWDYVFQRPDFPMLRRDGLFLTGLLEFLQEKKPAVGIWPSLSKVYAADFAQLPPEAAAISKKAGPLAAEEKVKSGLMALRDILKEPV